MMTASIKEPLKLGMQRLSTDVCIKTAGTMDLIKSAAMVENLIELLKRSVDSYGHKNFLPTNSNCVTKYSTYLFVYTSTHHILNKLTSWTFPFQTADEKNGKRNPKIVEMK
jgi:hypothetical protein